MKIKTSELTDAALDWAVAKCEGWLPYDYPGKQVWLERGRDARGAVILQPLHELKYSTNWAQGGPIIERKKIALSFNHDFQIWEAGIVNKAGDDFVVGHGPIPLIAAMRCHVASELGDEIDIPDELTKEPS